MKNDDIENKTKSKIYHLAFGYGIKAQIVKIRRKFFSTKRMALISSLVLLIAGSTVFFSANYFAKGATYGWLQSTWSGEADTGAVANHTDNRTLWTKFFSKDANVDTSNDQLTLSSGSSSVVQTTTTDFDAGAKSGFMIDTASVANQVTADFKYFNASGICSGFRGVYYVDSATAAWATAVSNCAALCSTCALPTLTELQCIYTNRASFGNNFVANYYWSATEYLSAYAYIVNFYNGSTDFNSKTLANYVRCVRR
jgi:hypothetical protein